MRANYEVEYYPGIPEEGVAVKRKGLINVNGYKVEDNAEEKKDRPFCMELHHPNVMRKL